MRIFITLYNNQMLMNIKNYMRKIFGLNYCFQNQTELGWEFKVWNDRKFGKPFKKMTLREDSNGVIWIGGDKIINKD